MHWLADYWWVILVLFVGVILNAIKDLKRVDHKNICRTAGNCRLTVIITHSGMMRMTGRIINLKALISSAVCCAHCGRSVCNITAVSCLSALSNAFFR